MTLCCKPEKALCIGAWAVMGLALVEGLFPRSLDPSQRKSRKLQPLCSTVDEATASTLSGLGQSERVLCILDSTAARLLDR